MSKGNNCIRELGTKVIWSIHWYSPIIWLSVQAFFHKHCGWRPRWPCLCRLILELITVGMSRAIWDLTQVIQFNKTLHQSGTVSKSRALSRAAEMFFSFIHFIVLSLPILAFLYHKTRAQLSYSYIYAKLRSSILPLMVETGRYVTLEEMHTSANWLM